MADDIPVFHLFFKPEYAAFNLFYWLKSVLQADSLLGKKFSPDLVNPEWITLAQEIYKVYCQIPSVEIWTEESMNSTLNQILYYWESGLFEDRKYAVQVVEQTIELLRTIQEQAELSSKLRNKRQSNEVGESYLMYVSELQIGNNCVLANIGDQRMVYVRHQTFNVLRSTNPTFFRETEMWVQNEIRKSSLISGVSEKHRYQFFQTLIRKTEKVLQKIMAE